MQPSKVELIRNKSLRIVKAPPPYVPLEFVELMNWTFLKVMLALTITLGQATKTHPSIKAPSRPLMHVSKS